MKDEKIEYIHFQLRQFIQLVNHFQTEISQKLLISGPMFIEKFLLIFEV